MDVERENQGQLEERLYTTPIPLLTFSSALFAKQHMDSIMKFHRRQSILMSNLQRVKDAYVMFTHFGKDPMTGAYQMHSHFWHSVVIWHSLVKKG